MAQIDIRKVEKPGFMYYESVQQDSGVTYIGRLKRITPEGRVVLLQRYTFCRMLRTLVGKLQRGELIDKPQLMECFGVVGRVFNTALIGAKGIIEGTQKALEADLEDKEQAIERQVKAIFDCEDLGEIEGRETETLTLRPSAPANP
jgi:hypothetical protein